MSGKPMLPCLMPCDTDEGGGGGATPPTLADTGLEGGRRAPMKDGDF